MHIRSIPIYQVKWWCNQEIKWPKRICMFPQEALLPIHISQSISKENHKFKQRWKPVHKGYSFHIIECIHMYNHLQIYLKPFPSILELYNNSSGCIVSYQTIEIHGLTTGFSPPYPDLSFDHSWRHSLKAMSMISHNNVATSRKVDQWWYALHLT